jgi:hypothetical protein
MKQIAYILAIIYFFSCKGSSPSKGTQERCNQYPSAQKTEDTAVQEEEWLLIGGKKVDNYAIEQKYDYYLKSEAKNIESVILYINSDDEKRAAGFEGIGQLENLKGIHIYLYGQGIDTLDYSPLTTLRNIEWLYLECPGRYKLEKIPDLSGMASRNNMKRIEFDNCALTSVDNIEFLPNLFSVLILNNYANLSNLKSLNRLSQLEALLIHSIDENSVFRIEEFSSLNKLKKLTLNGRIVDAKGIEQLRSLEDVDFGVSVIKNPQYISGAGCIKRLKFTIHDREPNIQFLGRGMTYLDALFIHAVPSTWGGATEEPYQILDVGPIGDIPQLESLVLRGFILRNLEGLDKLENMEGRILVRDCIITDKSGTTKWELLYDLFGGR